MRTKTKLVALKLTPTEALAVAELVEAGYFKSVSSLLRQALMSLLIDSKLKTETLVKIRLERIAHPMRRRKKTGESE